MDKKQTDAIAIRQRLHPSDDLIIVGVAVVVPADLTYLLERVNDDKGSAWMLPQKISELLVEAAAKLAEATGADCVQVIGSKFVLYLQKKKDSAYAALLK